jgi:hypothetical protein
VEPPGRVLSGGGLLGSGTYPKFPAEKECDREECFSANLAAFQPRFFSAGGIGCDREANTSRSQTRGRPHGRMEELTEPAGGAALDNPGPQSQALGSTIPGRGAILAREGADRRGQRLNNGRNITKPSPRPNRI